MTNAPGLPGTEGFPRCGAFSVKPERQPAKPGPLSHSNVIFFNHLHVVHIKRKRFGQRTKGGVLRKYYQENDKNQKN